MDSYWSDKIIRESSDIPSFNSIEWIPRDRIREEIEKQLELSIPLNGFDVTWRADYTISATITFQFHWMDSGCVVTRYASTLGTCIFQFHWMDSYDIF